MSPAADRKQQHGARFVRADLHVHTHSDSADAPKSNLDSYLDAAGESGIDVLAITDHNTTMYVRGALEAAEGKSIVVIPGIEISTHDGHLLALFAPDQIDTLEAFATTENLKLKTLSAREKRSKRAMLDLVSEIEQRGGLAIPAAWPPPLGPVSLRV
jgi:predicted metal-dependent phosphoesterase TrpH